MLTEFPGNENSWNKGPASYLREIMGKDYLTPGLTKTLTTEVVQMFFPFNWKQMDRASIMEASWEKSWARICKNKGKNCGLQRPLSTLWSNTDARNNLPLLLNNGIDVTSGSRLNVSVLNGSCNNKRQELHDKIISSYKIYSNLLRELRKYDSKPGRKTPSETEKMLKQANWLRLHLLILILGGEQDQLQTHVIFYHRP